MSVTTEDPFVAQAEAAADFLSHYGVKGMKWGQRKDGKPGSSRGKSGVIKEAPSEDSARVMSTHARVKTQKQLHQLTNKELQAAIERMRLEQQYSQMTGGLDKTTKQKAQSWVRDMAKDLLGGGETLAKNFGNDQVKLAVEKKTKTGRHDPLAVAKREADMAGAQARKRQADAVAR